ncbi:hypothetical protein T492DRAFT_890277 [Pavlovales sp. CCMP2436]|nr:hypothetical protein T492DRAFT_890277 [Pavlovales sp. CCMP2436]
MWLTLASVGTGVVTFLGKRSLRTIKDIADNGVDGKSVGKSLGQVANAFDKLVLACENAVLVFAIAVALFATLFAIVVYGRMPADRPTHAPELGDGDERAFAATGTSIALLAEVARQWTLSAKGVTWSGIPAFLRLPRLAPRRAGLAVALGLTGALLALAVLKVSLRVPTAKPQRDQLDGRCSDRSSTPAWLISTQLIMGAAAPFGSVPTPDPDAERAKELQRRQRQRQRRRSQPPTAASAPTAVNGMQRLCARLELARFSGVATRSLPSRSLFARFSGAATRSLPSHLALAAHAAPIALAGGGAGGADGGGAHAARLNDGLRHRLCLALGIAVAHGHVESKPTVCANALFAFLPYESDDDSALVSPSPSRSPLSTRPLRRGASGDDDDDDDDDNDNEQPRRNYDDSDDDDEQRRMLDDDDYDDELDAFGVLAAQNAQDARDAQMASASPLAPERANPKRAIEDTLDPPPVGWTMPRSILMKDGADAASTAIEQVWPTAADSDPVMVAMCNIHIQEFAFETMLEKWYKKGEGMHADKFEHWMDVPWTRAELN